MSDVPGDPNRESIPLLLARTTSRIALAPKEARASLRVPSTRAESAGPIGYLRSRLGAAGTLVAAALVLFAIFADMLANDLPIACKLHGQLWLFPNITQPAELVALGGDATSSEAEWKVSALVPHGPTSPTAAPLLAPGRVTGHPFGTDREGRDVFARVIHGTRTYLVFALAAVMVSLLFGGLLGSLAGLFGGGADALVGRAIETVSAFPPLVLVLGIQAAVPHATVATLFLAIALTRWPEVARLVRAEVMQVATRDYVMAARALGASPLRVLRRHIAPNVRGQLIVLGAIGVPAVILIEASLDFLRVGPPAGAASWGETMSEFRDAPMAWWLLAFPGVFLFATIVALNLVGEARREMMDPRTR
ncbi:MAG: Dipeptide transport system permease protein DppC [Labilithrix sp.]|nr:Dipeptide transport system permease protein DppC [Labilithrix sp.]